MKIFAIDPGNTDSAYCVLDDEFNLLDFDKTENTNVINKIIGWLDEERPDVVVIERIASYGMAVGREVFETCEWIGRFSEAAVLNSVDDVQYIYRKDEKVNLCGSTKAKDANIRQALIDRFAKHDMKNGRGTKKNPDYFYGVKADIWAAIAVGVTYLDMQKEKKNV